MQKDSRGRVELKLTHGYVANGARRVFVGGKLKPLLVPKWVQETGKPTKALGQVGNAKVHAPKTGRRSERETFEKIMSDLH